MSQRSARNRSACASVSTPSAVTQSPSAWASRTRASTIRSSRWSATSGSSPRMPSTNGAASFRRGDRQPPQVRQVRVPGAEVVDRQPYAEGGEPVQRPQRLFRGAHHRALGQLQLQQLRRQSAAGQGVDHGVHDRRGVGLAGGQVHADHQPGVGKLGVPPLGVPAGLAQHPLAQPDDQAGLLGQPDEPVRADQPQLRVLPADQRLDRQHPSVQQRHDRLVVQHELAPVQRHRQPGDQGRPGDVRGRCAPGRTPPTGPGPAPWPSTAWCRAAFISSATLVPTCSESTMPMLAETMSCWSSTSTGAETAASTASATAITPSTGRRRRRPG